MPFAALVAFEPRNMRCVFLATGLTARLASCLLLRFISTNYSYPEAPFVPVLWTAPSDYPHSPHSPPLPAAPPGSGTAPLLEVWSTGMRSYFQTRFLPAASKPGMVLGAGINMPQVCSSVAAGAPKGFTPLVLPAVGCG